MNNSLHDIMKTEMAKAIVLMCTEAFGSSFSPEYYLELSDEDLRALYDEAIHWTNKAS